MTNPRPDTHARIPVSDIATLLAERAEDLCRHLLPGGHREGSEWRCGSVQGEAGKSMGVHLNGTKTGRWKDYNGGESGDPIDLIQACLRLDKGEAVQWAKSWLGIDDRASTSTPRPRPAAKPESVDERAAKRTEAALVIWRASRDPIGTLTTTYLHHRGIICKIPPSIRDHLGLKHAETGQNFPAMVAAITGADRKVIAVHRTFLRCDGRGKANVRKPKMALGPMGDGAVRLGPAGPALGLSEGVESGLSATQLFDLPVWCSLSASRLDRLGLPPESVEIHLFGDNGAPGHEAVERAVKAYQAQGRRVVVRFPPERFGDWNDALCEEAAA